MGSLLSFLGGSAFRMLWGEISSYLSKKQDHKFEQQRMLLQSKLDAEQHSRSLESLRVQAELGVKTIQVQADADTARIEMDAWREAVAGASKNTGIKLIDAWNGAIRPAFGTLALVLVLLFCRKLGWDMAASAGVTEVVFGIIGYFFASRDMGRRGK